MTTAVAYGSTFPNTQDTFYATHRSPEALAADKANIAELDQVAAASKEPNTGCGAAVKGWVCKVAAKVRGKDHPCNIGKIPKLWYHGFWTVEHGSISAAPPCRLRRDLFCHHQL